MSSTLFAILAALLIGAQARYVIYELPEETFVHPSYVGSDINSIRVRRDAHGSISTNPDGSPNFNVKAPIAGNNQNVLSAIGSINGKEGSRIAAASAGLALDNVNGHGLAATVKHIPNFGDQLTAAAKVNVINTGDHKLDANAFVTKNMPSIPHVPNFDTKGASVDYLFNNKAGASFSAAQTPFLQRTDLAATGNLNLFRDPTTSLDFNAGYSKTMSPYINNNSWKPVAGFSFSKFW